MKKILDMFKKSGLFFVFFQIQTYADIEERLNNLEANMRDIYFVTPYGTDGTYFAPNKQIDGVWGVEGEILLWHVKSGGANWVILLDQVEDPVQGSMKNLGFDWSLGLRAGLRKHYAQSDGDVSVLYTYYRTQDSQKVFDSFSSPQALNGTQGYSGIANSSFSAKISYNALDLALKKEYFISHNFLVEPFIGIKSAWLNEQYKLNITNQIDLTESFTPVQGTVNIKLKDINKLWGIGPQVGNCCFWYLTDHFYMRSLAEAALLHSYFDVRQNVGYFVAPLGVVPTETTSMLSGKMHAFIPFGRLMIGVGWNKDFEDQKKIEISLNYEINYFWRENQMINQSNTNPNYISITQDEPVRLLLERLSEDLQFYGVTFTVGFDF